MATSATAWVIQPVGHGHWPVCRSLLPDLRWSQSPLSYGYLAIQSAIPNAAGASVVRVFGNEAWISIRVVSAARRNGIGSELMQSCLVRGREIGAATAVVNCDTTASPESAHFLTRLGFSAGPSCTTYEADFRQAKPALTHVRDRLLADGRLPEQLKIVPLSEAPEHEVARLIAAHVADRVDLAQQPLRLDEDTERWRDSVVLLVDGTVAAVALTEFSGDTATVAARVVVPGFRGGWANAVLLGSMADVGVARGSRRFRFESRDDNGDTIKLARRVNATAVATRQRFERSLSGT